MQVVLSVVHFVIGGSLIFPTALVVGNLPSVTCCLENFSVNQSKKMENHKKMQGLSGEEFDSGSIRRDVTVISSDMEKVLLCSPSSQSEADYGLYKHSRKGDIVSARLTETQMRTKGLVLVA